MWNVLYLCEKYWEMASQTNEKKLAEKDEHKFPEWSLQSKYNITECLEMSVYLI